MKKTAAGRKPDRTGDEAHFGDVLGYTVWRFFPRRGTMRNHKESDGGSAAGGAA